jgi:Beta-lactamase
MPASHRDTPVRPSVQARTNAAASSGPSSPGMCVGQPSPRSTERPLAASGTHATAYPATTQSTATRPRAVGIVGRLDGAAAHTIRGDRSAACPLPAGPISTPEDTVVSHRRAIRQVRDPALRARLRHLFRQVRVDPTLQAPAMLWVRFAAALPLRSVPGTTYHYSNIGYDILGLIAAKVGGAPLRTLYRRRIIEPLGLSSAAYQPRGEFSGPRPREYSVHLNGRLVDATGWYRVARVPAPASSPTRPTKATSSRR